MFDLNPFMEFSAANDPSPGVHVRTLQREPPLGVSVVNIVYVMAKQAVDMGSYKLARFAYNKLQVCLAGHYGLQVCMCAGVFVSVCVCVCVCVCLCVF